MKKLILGSVLILLVNAPSSFAASAYKTALTLMIDTKIANEKTVRHNLDVYQKVLNAIASKVKDKNSYHAEKKTFVITALNFLDSSLNRQMGAVGPVVRPILAPRLTRALLTARKAAERYDYPAILAMVTVANREINELRNL